MEGEWELCKENFVPVKSGRRVGALQDVADPGDSSKKTTLEQQKRAFVTEIRDYSGEDALEPWLRYIKWTQEHLTGSGKQDLQAVLEACTQEVARHERYVTDVRFLRVWIQYADCLPDPGDVFLFLKEKQMGLEFALFHEAYATYHELRGNCAAADAVYEDGISRQAKPLERLKTKYFGFHTRMAQRTQRKIQEQALLGPQAAPLQRESLMQLPAPGSRHPLPPSAASGRAAHHTNSAQGGASAAPPTSHTAGVRPPSMFQAFQSSSRPAQPQQQQQQQGQPAAPSSLWGRPPSGLPNSTPNPAADPGSSQASGSGLSARGGSGAAAGAGGSAGREGGPGPVPGSGMHVDEEFEEGSVFRPSLSGPAAGPAGNPSRGLMPYAQVRKENLTTPGTWAGQGFHTSKQQLPSSSAAASSAAALEIFTDEEFLAEDPAPPNMAAAAAAVAGALPFGSQLDPAPTRRALEPAVGGGLSGQGLGSAAAAAGSTSAGPPPSRGQEAAAPVGTSTGPQPALPRGLGVHAAAPTPAISRPAASAPPDCSFRAELLHPPGGEEVSYTELRARAWREKRHRSGSSSSGSSSSHTASAAAGSSLPAASLTVTVPSTLRQPIPAVPAAVASAAVSHPRISNSVTAGPGGDQAQRHAMSCPTAGAAAAAAAASQVQLLAAAGSPPAAQLLQAPMQTQARPGRPGATQTRGGQDVPLTRQHGGSSAGVAPLPHTQQPLTQRTPPASDGGVARAETQPTVAAPGMCGSELPAQPSVHAGLSARPAPCATPQLAQLPSPQPATEPHPRVQALGPARAPKPTMPTALPHTAFAPHHIPPSHTSAPPPPPPPPPPAPQSRPASQPAAETAASHAQQVPLNTLPHHAQPRTQPATQPRRQLAPQPVIPPHTPMCATTIPATTPTTTATTAPALARALQPAVTQTYKPPPAQQPIMPSHTPMPAAPAAAAPAPEPTVTMSTKAAFDALNDMFSDGSSHVGSSQQQQQQQPQQQQQQRKRVMEPTVTMNTQAAFEALNGMFSDSLPLQEADADTGAGAAQRGRADDSRMSSLPASLKPISAMDVCRLANTGKVNSVQSMRDAPAARQQSVAPSSSMMYEDTDFIVPASLAARNMSTANNEAGMGQPLPAPFLNQARPLIYEDTDVFMMPALPVQQPSRAPPPYADPHAQHQQQEQQQQQQRFNHPSSQFEQTAPRSMPPLGHHALAGAVDENAGLARQIPLQVAAPQAHYQQPPSNVYFGGQHSQMPWGPPAATQLGIYEDTELLLQDRG
ncbi:MAG: hypothetical protein WDW36_007768 [Sanguina aurantia]